MQSKIRDFRHTPAFAAMTWALGIGILVHLFGLTNVLHNHDNIWVEPVGFGGGIEVGRWLLFLMGKAAQRLGFGYNLPFVNGTLYLVFLSCAAGGAVSVLHLRSKTAAALCGVLLVVFPSVTSVMFYKFTTAYYGIAMILAVFAVWVLPKHPLAVLLSAACIACSMGIYQAYVPMTISLMVLQLLKEALTGTAEFPELFKRGLRDCAALLLGAALYFGVLNGLLALLNVELDSYQGVDQMGNLSLQALPTMLAQTYRTFFLVPLEDYCSIAHSPFLRFAFLCTGLLTGGMVLLLAWENRKNRMRAVLAVLLLALLPAGINFIMIMCASSQIHTLMVYSFVLVPCGPLIFLEDVLALEAIRKKAGRVCKLLAAGLACLMIMCYGYDANVHYTAMYYANRQVENYWAGLVTQVRMTDGFTADKQWALIGDISDPLLNSEWKNAMSYGGHCFTDDLLKMYSRLSWVENYIGYDIPLADQETTQALARTEAVENMPSWPDQGSIQVIGDKVVIKFQELDQS